MLARLMPTTFATLDELRGAAGRQLGWTDWVDITQERVNLFADATGDHQWIHVDVERANGREPVRWADRPRLPHPRPVQPVPPPAARGAGRVRRASTTAPARCGSRARCRSGSRVRGGAEITAVEEIAGGAADDHHDHRSRSRDRTSPPASSSR